MMRRSFVPDDFSALQRRNEPKLFMKRTISEDNSNDTARNRFVALVPRDEPRCYKGMLHGREEKTAPQTPVQLSGSNQEQKAFQQPFPPQLQHQTPASPHSITRSSSFRDTPESPTDGLGDSWETAEHSAQNQPPEPASVRVSIRNVNESIDPNALKVALSKFDKITYFDISRPTNAAFVEFATQAGYNSAVAANPHTVNGQVIYVEERRHPGGQFPRYPSRGGSISRGRGGSFAPRGRGSVLTSRGGGNAAA